MKHNYPHGFALSMPYLDTNDDGSTSMKRVLLSTNSPCNRRRIKRTIVRWVKDNLGRQLYNHELNLLMKQIIKHKEPRFYLRAS